jgi:hypothetical protein
MKINDVVFQNYGGVHRYGKVLEIKENFEGDGWIWAKIDWIDDEQFVTSQKWKAQMRGLKENTYLPEYYRSDDIQKIDLNKTIKTLLKFEGWQE